MQRRCQHAALVRALPRFADPANDDGDESEASDKEQVGARGAQGVESPDGADAIDDEALIAATRFRARRNLVACVEEDKLCTRWGRTAEWAAIGDAPAGLFSRRPSTPEPDGGAGSQSVHPDPDDGLSPVLRLARYGLTFDPGEVLVEQTCLHCGAEKQESTAVDDGPARLYTDGNGGRSVEVC